MSRSPDATTSPGKSNPNDDTDLSSIKSRAMALQQRMREAGSPSPSRDADRLEQLLTAHTVPAPAPLDREVLQREAASTMQERIKTQMQTADVRQEELSRKFNFSVDGQGVLEAGTASPPHGANSVFQPDEGLLSPGAQQWRLKQAQKRAEAWEKLDAVEAGDAPVVSTAAPASALATPGSGASYYAQGATSFVSVSVAGDPPVDAVANENAVASPVAAPRTVATAAVTGTPSPAQMAKTREEIAKLKAEIETVGA